jgi:hypothetical protein
MRMVSPSWQPLAACAFSSALPVVHCARQVARIQDACRKLARYGLWEVGTRPRSDRRALFVLQSPTRAGTLYPQFLHRPLIRRLHTRKAQMLVYLQTLLTPVPADQLDLRIRQPLRRQPTVHLVPEQMGCTCCYACGGALLAHVLLHPGSLRILVCRYTSPYRPRLEYEDRSDMKIVQPS